MNAMQRLVIATATTAALWSAAAVAHAADAPKGDRYALLVGVHQYPDAKGLAPQAYAERKDVTLLNLAVYVTDEVQDFVREEYEARQSPQLTGDSRGTPPLIAATDEIRSYRRGEACREKKEYDKAVADYTEAIRLDPQYASAYRNRGNAYKKMGDADRAKADYDKADQLDKKK